MVNYLACRAVAVVLLAAAGPAGQGIPDLIPEDAAAALAIRGRDQLEKKGDRFIADCNLKLGREGRPSHWFKQMLDNLGIKDGFDGERPVAVILPNLKKMEHERLDLEVLQFLVLAVPFTDLDKMDANFGFAAGELKPGALKKRDRRNNVWIPHVFMAKDQHLFMGFDDKAVRAVAESKGLGGNFGAGQKAVLERSDIVLHLGPESWGEVGKGVVDDLEREIRRGNDPAVKKGEDEVVAAARAVRAVTAGLRLDGGLALTVVAGFKTEGGKLPDFLSALRSGTGKADLAGLPAVDPLFAYAARGEGRKTILVVRPLMRIALDELLGLRSRVTPEVWKGFFGLFEGWYDLLQGSRAVVYARGPARGAGAFGVVGILDTEDPQGLIASWHKLVRQAAGRDFGAPGVEVTLTPNAETLGENRVDVLTFKFRGLGETDQAKLTQLLGPEWNKMLLVVQGKTVVWMVGSDNKSMRQALDNLKAGKPGLAERPTLVAAGGRVVPARMLAVYFSMKNLAVLKDAPDKIRAGAAEALSALAVSVEADRIQVDVWVPAAEIRAVQAGSE